MAKHIDLDLLFAALADPTRRSVIARLASGSASVGELAVPAGMALPSFMKHLAVLEGCGLIRSRKQGRVRTCELAPEALAPLGDWLDAQRRIWDARHDQLERLAIAMEERKPQ